MHMHQEPKLDYRSHDRPLGERQRVQLLLEGEEDGRRGDKKMIAISRCSIAFDNEEDLQKCIKALEASDIALRNRPEEMMLWDWNITTRSGMVITFGVSWYDRVFYGSRKDAFQDMRHIQQYEKFGASLSDFEVTHFVLDE